MAADDIKNFVKAVRGILRTHIGIKDTKQINTLTSPEMMFEYFLPSVTHVTYDSNPGKYYEGLETIGDAAVGASFYKFLFQKLPGLDPLRYTELKTYFLGNMFMKNLTRRLKLETHIRFVGDIEISDYILADVFEAFCGALVFSGDRYVSGLGDVLLYNLIVNLYNNEDYTIDRGSGNEITQTDQALQILSAPPLKKESFYDEKTRKVSFKLYLKQFAVTILKREGFKIDENQVKYGKMLIGESNEFTKKNSKQEAYNQAWKFLSTIGLTRDWLINYKHQKNFSNPLLKPYIKGAFQKARDEGFINLAFYKPNKAVDDKSFIIFLQGVYVDKETGDTLRKNIIVKTFSSKNVEDIQMVEESRAHAEILKEYLEEK